MQSRNLHWSTHALTTEQILNLGSIWVFCILFFQADRLSLYAAIGSGPHYITVETDRQARGFIFSDNFELGSAYNFERINTAFLLKFRFRHISNAGLKEPNGGIDNFFVIAGLSANW
jgi:hypothetical protein